MKYLNILVRISLNYISLITLSIDSESLRLDCYSKVRFRIKEIDEESKDEIRKRRRKNSIIDIENHLQRLSNLLNRGIIVKIYGRAKSLLNRGPRTSQRSNTTGLSLSSDLRRSSYIGVSKNGKNWQVLINCGKDKKYIGTYTDEKEAAIAYDFFSICLHIINEFYWINGDKWSSSRSIEAGWTWSFLREDREKIIGAETSFQILFQF